MKMKRRNLTLIEVIVVMTVLAIIASSAAPVFINDHHARLCEQIAGTMNKVLTAQETSWNVNAAWQGSVSDLKTNNFLPATWSETNVFGNNYNVTNSTYYSTVSTVVPEGFDGIFSRLTNNPTITNSGGNSTITVSTPIPGWSNSLQGLHDIYVNQTGDTNVSGNIAANVAGVTLTFSQFIDYDNTGFLLDPAGTSTLNNVEADVYYSRSDNNYYVVPNGTSILSQVRGDIFYARTNTSYFLDPDGLSEFYRGDFASWMRAPIVYDLNNTSYYLDANGNSELYQVDAAQRVRTPIVYDLNNTSYFMDPASTSRLNYVDANNIRSRGYVQVGNTSTSTNGIIRYNSTQFQFRENGVWRTLGGLKNYRVGHMITSGTGNFGMTIPADSSASVVEIEMSFIRYQNGAGNYQAGGDAHFFYVYSSNRLYWSHSSTFSANTVGIIGSNADSGNNTLGGGWSTLSRIGHTHPVAYSNLIARRSGNTLYIGIDNNIASQGYKVAYKAAYW